MKYPFLILSTPRSGSAWLANFLTYEGCLCIHEPTVWNNLQPSGHWLKGGIDTAAVHFLSDVLVASDPNTRVYQLRRNEEDVKASVDRLGLSYTPTPDLGFKTWRYEELFQLETLKGIWDEIVGTPIDENRARMLIEMNVQHDISVLKSRVEERLCRSAKS
jgi:hypothetical protein